MIPSALLRKMPAQERDCGPAEAEKACIHLRGQATEHVHTHLCLRSVWGREERFGMTPTIYSNYCYPFLKGGPEGTASDGRKGG